MLLYHPMLDPYHCSLRAFSLLTDSDVGQLEWERLRLLDFLIAFPHSLKEMRVPIEFRSRRVSLKAVPEPYETLPNLTRVFYQVSEIQAAGMRLLVAAELVEKSALENGIVRARKAQGDQLDKLTMAMRKRELSKGGLVSIRSREKWSEKTGQFFSCFSSCTCRVGLCRLYRCSGFQFVEYVVGLVRVVVVPCVRPLFVKVAQVIDAIPFPASLTVSYARR